MASVRIYQLQDGYCYNTDSLVLAYFAKKFLKKKMRVLDVGAGSGILGILCAREITQCLGGEVDLHLVEQDAAMSVLAQKNASVFGASVHCMEFQEFKSEEKFDFIITNPPFYTKHAPQGQNERKNKARNQQFLPLDILFKQVKSLLKPNGMLCMCYDARLCTELFAQLHMRGLHIDEIRFLHSLPDRESTLILLKAKIQSKSPLKVLPPIFTHLSSRQSDNTQELQEIYAWAQTQSIKVDSVSLV